MVSLTFILQVTCKKITQNSPLELLLSQSTSKFGRLQCMSTCSNSLNKTPEAVHVAHQSTSQIIQTEIKNHLKIPVKDLGSENLRCLM